MSRFLVLSLCLCLIASILIVAPAVAANPFPRAATAYLVKNGETTVWSQGARRRLPPASLTKMMTALVVMEHADFQEVVTVSPVAAAATGSRLRLRAGDRLRVGDLLAAILLNSANDAARALAEHVAGSEEAFAALMNRKAADLGMNATHFTNASGFDDPQHFSTAADLALLAETALSHPPFRGMVGLPDMEIGTIDGERLFQLRNTNRLLGSYDGLIGGKTGFTAKAGPCLMVAAERGESRVLVILLNSPSRWYLAPMILDRAFGALAKAREKTQLASLATLPAAH